MAEVRISGLTESNKRTPRTEPNIHKSPKRRTADDRGNRKSQRIYTANNNRNTSTANTNTMRIYKHLMAIALIALASAGIQFTQAQEEVEEQENYVWITNTNGITEKEVITRRSFIYFDDWEKHEVAQIVVPEHANIGSIDIRGCVNLTNLIYRPASARSWQSSLTHPNGGYYTHADKLSISPTPSLRTIAMQPQMIPKTEINIGRSANVIPAWLLSLEWTTNWQVGDPPKMEIRNITTSRGKEVEVIWREGNLQIGDAVNGEWKDYNGSSPLRFPLITPFVHPKDMQFFRIKPEEQEEPEENQGTPPQPEK